MSKMSANSHHGRHLHPHYHSQANHFNSNFHLHAREAQSISITDPLPIPTLSGLDPTGAVESATATGSKLVLPSGVPASEDSQSVVTGTTTTTTARSTPSSVAASRSLSSKGSVSSSSSDSSASGDDTSNLSIPAVIGICIGVFVGLALLILFVVWWSKRRTHKSHIDLVAGRGRDGRDNPNGGSFEQIVSGEDAASKGLEGAVGVGRTEKPPSYKSFIAASSSTPMSSRTRLTMPVHTSTNSQFSPISPSSQIMLKSKSPVPIHVPAAHMSYASTEPEPESDRSLYTETVHGQTLAIQTHAYDYYQRPHTYASVSPLLSSCSFTPMTTTPHSATAFAKSADGSGAHSVFGAMQAQYRETGALLEGRSPTNSAIPTPTSTPTCSTHATFITAASELRFDSSLGMSDTFHDRSSLHTYSTLDPDASYTAPSDDDDEHSHSYLMMRNSNSDLTLQNLQMPPEAKSPAFRFDFRQAHLMEHEGEVVTSTASTSVIESESAEVRAGNGMVMVGLGSRMDLYEARDMAESSRTTIYSPPSPSSTRPPFSNAHKRSDTSETITITNKNLFSYTHGHALPKLDIDSQNPSLPPAQTHIPGHKHTRMASLLAALDIPVTPSTETHSGFDTGADADTDTDAYEETETETDVDTEVFPMPPASVVSAIR